jgi:hypothetical protein
MSQRVGPGHSSLNEVNHMALTHCPSLLYTFFEALRQRSLERATRTKCPVEVGHTIMIRAGIIVQVT